METSSFVFPAEIYLSRDPNVVIETCLGSCVGIALYDPTSRTGGIAHIILPQGYKLREASTPAKYASSGISYLIKRLIEAGARREYLVAKISGGALMSQNAEINIGMRNIAKVREVLFQQNIPILEEDVGGHLGIKSRLRIKDGEVEVKTISKDRARFFLPLRSIEGVKK